MKDIDADFSHLLSKDDEKQQPSFDFTDEISYGFTNPVLGWFNGKPIFYQNKQYICFLSSGRRLTLVNTNYEGLTKHGHLHIKVDKNNKIDLSTVKYIVEKCLLGKQYPKSNYTWECCMRLSDDKEYREFLVRKKQRMKDRPKYQNTHKKGK